MLMMYELKNEPYGAWTILQPSLATFGGDDFDKLGNTYTTKITL